MTPGIPNPVYLIHCSDLTFEDRLTCTSIQGVLNKAGPRVFLNYGYYDKLSDRITNEVFIDDERWFGKYRAMIGQQDLRNLSYYQSQFDFPIEEILDYHELIRQEKSSFKGFVVWDPALIETISLATMLSGLERLLIIAPNQVSLSEETDLPIVEDLRGRWVNRLELYRWAFEHLFERCNPGVVASLEPGWQHPEFFDYAIQNNIFTYSLATDHPHPIFTFGKNLLLLLFAGPRKIRNALFGSRLDKVIKAIGCALMDLASPETRLAGRIQKRVVGVPVPTIFGWHTCRDSELTFMLHLSAHNLRLVPCHMAGNFSFHSRLPGPESFQQKLTAPIPYDPNRIYLTFTLSDGDQLMMMNTGELGNWYQPERGRVAFNWEVQPLLVEIAPALLGKFYETATALDCLVAGPSGAGYTIQPLMGNIAAYTQDTDRVCRQAGIQVVTSYDCAPPQRVLNQMLALAPHLSGYLGGYVYFGDAVQTQDQQGTAFVSSLWPPLDGIHASAEDVIQGVREIIARSQPPAFISVHLFAYRTSITDIHHFVQSLDAARITVVRADQFLQLARQHLDRKDAHHD